MEHPRRTLHRSLRVGALAVASGTAVVAAATGAGAAPASAPGSYAGDTLSTAVNLSVLKGVPGLSSLPSSVDTSDGLVSLQLLPASAAVVHSASGSPANAAGSRIALVGGTLASLATASGQSSTDPSAVSSIADPGPNSAGGLVGLPDPFTLGPAANGSIPALTAATDTSALSTTSAGTGLDLSALTLSDLTDTSSFAAGCATLSSEFTSALTQLNGLTGTVPGLANLQAAITTAQTEAARVCSQLLNGAAVSLQGLQSTSSISLVNGQEVSTAHVELGSISLFGGLLTGTGFNNTVTAKVGGTTGTASFTPVVADGGFTKLTLAGNSLAIDSAGIQADIPGLPAAVTAALGTLVTSLESGLTTLNTSLQSAGGLVSITADTPTDVEVASDGTLAKGELSGLSIAINVPSTLPTSLPTTLPSTLPTTVPTTVPTALPTVTPTIPSLGAHATTPSTQVLDLTVGSVGAEAEATNLTTKVKGETFSKTPTASGPAPATKLAFTGADLPVTGGVALLLVLGGAYAIRRRRAGHDEL